MASHRVPRSSSGNSKKISVALVPRSVQQTCPRRNFQENLALNAPDPDLMLLICAYLKQHFPQVSEALKQKLLMSNLLPSSINPITGNRERMVINDVDLPDHNRLPTIVSTMIDVASTAVFDNTSNMSGSSNLSFSSVNPSIISIIRAQLIHDPSEIKKRNKSIVKALSLYHRYESILSRAVHYEKQLKFKLEETQNINATTIGNNGGAARQTNGGGEDDLDRRSCVYMVKRHESTGKFGCDLKELIFNNSVVGITLVSISHRPDLKTPVFLQAINGFPIKPLKLERAIELVVKVDGITEACRFDVVQRLRGKESITLEEDQYGHCKVNPLTLYYSEIPKTSGLYFRISRQKNIQTRVRKWMNQGQLKDVVKRYNLTMRTNSPPQHMAEKQVHAGIKEASRRKMQIKRYGYGRSAIDKGTNILTRVLNKQRYGRGKSILNFRGRPNPVKAMQGYDKNSSFYFKNRFDCLKILNGHLCEPVYNCCLDRSGRYVFTGADDGLIKCWSVDTGRLLYTLRGQRGAISEMKVDINNKYIAATDTGTQNEIRFSSVSTGETVAVLKGHSKSINGMDFDVATGCLITVAEDGKARVWHPSCWHEVAPTHEIPERSEASIWNRTSDLIGNDSNLALAQQLSSEAMEASHSQLQYAELEHFLMNGKTKIMCDVNCVGVSPTGHYFATGSQQDFKTRIWRVETRETPLRMKKADYTHKFKYKSQDHKSVVVTLITELFGVMKGIWDIAFSNLGDRLLTTTRHNVLRVYTFRDDESGYSKPKVKEFTHKRIRFYAKNEGSGVAHDVKAHTSTSLGGKGISSRAKGARSEVPIVTKGVWSRCDSRVISAQSFCEDDKVPDNEKIFETAIVVWDGYTGERLETIYPHKKPIYTMETHPHDPRILLTAGWDGTTVISDIFTGTILYTYVNKFRPTRAGIPRGVPGQAMTILDGKFSNDGNSIYCTDGNGRLLIFGCFGESLDIKEALDEEKKEQDTLRLPSDIEYDSLFSGIKRANEMQATVNDDTYVAANNKPMRSGTSSKHVQGRAKESTTMMKWSFTLPGNNYNNVPEEQYMMQDYHPLDHDAEGWCQDTDYNIAPWLIPAHNNALIAADTSLYPVQPLPYRPNVFNTAPMNTTDDEIRRMLCLSDGPSVMKEEHVRKDMNRAKALLDMQLAIRRLNKAYVKMRVAKLEGKYKEGTGMFSMRKRYAAMKNRGKPAGADTSKSGQMMPSSARRGNRRATTSQPSSSSGSAALVPSRTAPTHNVSTIHDSAAPSGRRTSRISYRESSDDEGDNDEDVPDDPDDEDFVIDEDAQRESSSDDSSDGDDLAFGEQKRKRRKRGGSTQQESKPWIAPTRSSRRLGRRERVNYAAFDVNSDIDMDEEDNGGDDENSLAHLVLKEASYEKRDGVRFDRDWLLQEKPYDQNSPVSFYVRSVCIL